MKKFISVLLSVILLLSVAPSYALVQGETADVVFALSDGGANVGENVSLSLTASGESFSVAALDLLYDSSGVRLVGVTSTAGFSCDFLLKEEGATVLLYGGTDLTGEVADLEFETIAVGEFDVTVNVSEGNISNKEANGLSVSSASAVITVSCEHQYVYNRTIEPTCIKEGEYVYTCYICGEDRPSEQNEKIEKLPHTKGEEKILIEPDCVTEGLKDYFCVVCDQAMGETSVVAAKGHTLGEWMIEKNPTCTEDGQKIRICEECEAVVTETISKEEHVATDENSTWTVIKPANCGEAGVEALICNDCGEQRETREIAAVESHDYVWAVTKEATCSEAGQYSNVCRICGNISESSEIEKLDHTVGEAVITVEPDCENSGTQTVSCTVCQEVLETKTLEALGHNYIGMNVITAPTDKSEGSAQKQCTVCDHIEDVVLPVTNAYIKAGKVTVVKSQAKETFKIPVSIENSSLFYAGMFEVTYDASVISFEGVSNTSGLDITLNTSESGKIKVLLTADAEIEDTLLFNLLFKFTDKPAATEICLGYDAQTGFSDGEELVFFNFADGGLIYEAVLDGDVNGDGTVDILDLRELKLAVAGVKAIQNKEQADINWDGKVNITDLAILKKAVASVITLE